MGLQLTRLSGMALGHIGLGGMLARPLHCQSDLDKFQGMGEGESSASDSGREPTQLLLYPTSPSTLG